MRTALLLALLAASPSWAACQGDEAFSCTIGKKTLQVCYWKGALIYSFGPEGNPDLTITEPLETAAFTPWPGIGSDIWETVAFPNEGYTYEVWTSVRRDPEAPTGLQGGVNVLQGEELVARLECDAGTPTASLDVIYGLKDSIGQCWDFNNRSWQTVCN